MKADVEFESPAAIFAFADESVGSEVRTGEAAEAESLHGRAKAGEAFFLEGDNPSHGHFHVYVDEPVPEEIEKVCTVRSGSFLLRLPTGRLSVCGLGTGSPETEESPETWALEVPPGDYSVTLLDGSVQDMSAVMAQQKVLVDAADWRLYERVNHFGAFGCMTLAMGMLFVLIPTTRREYWFLLPLFLLPTCAFTLLRRLPGYTRVQELCREHQAGLPRYVFSMTRVETTEGLEGGWYRRK